MLVVPDKSDWKGVGALAPYLVLAQKIGRRANQAYVRHLLVDLRQNLSLQSGTSRLAVDGMMGCTDAMWAD